MKKNHPIDQTPVAAPSDPLSADFVRYAQSGDLSGLERVFDTAGPSLLRVARRMLRDKSSAEDVVQETFMAAIKSADQFDPTRPVGPWLMGTLIHRVRSEQRRQGRRNGLVHELEEDDAALEIQPADTLESRELVHEIREALEKLPAGERAVVTARLFDGLRAGEVAKRLGLQPGTTRVRLHRGLQRLRQSLPASLAHGLIGWMRDRRSIAQLRSRVLDGGRAHAQAAGISSPSGGTLTGASGTWIATGVWPILLGLVGVSLLAWMGLGHGANEANGAPSTLARASGAAPQGATPTTGAARRRDAIPAAASSPTPSPTIRPVGGGVLRGRVVHEDGRSLAGALVRGWCSNKANGSPDLTTISDANGEFTLDGLGPEFVADAVLEGHAVAYGLQGQLVEGEVADGLAIELGLATTLRGRVEDFLHGQPVEGARVEARFAYGSRGGSRLQTAFPSISRLSGCLGETVTDSRGAFVLHGVHGAHAHLHVTRDGYFPWVAYGSEYDESQAIRLDPGAHVRGIVRTADGQPAIGAHVRFRGGNVQRPEHVGEDGKLTRSYHGTTDANGMFHLTGTGRIAPSPYGRKNPCLTILHDGHAVQVVQPVVPSTHGQAELIQVDLERAKPIEGRIVDNHGLPVEGARIDVLGTREMRANANWGRRTTWEWAAGQDRVFTDAAGRFSFPHLYDGAFELKATPATDPAGGLRKIVQAGTDDVELVFDPNTLRKVAVSGTVRNGVTGEPVQSFTVLPFVDGRAFNCKFENADGTYRVQGLEEGEVQVTVQALGFARTPLPAQTFKEGEYELDVELWPRRLVKFRVLDRAGNPLAGAKVRATDANGQKLPMDHGGPVVHSSATADRDGRGVAAGLPARQVILEASFANETQTVSVDLTNPVDEVLLVLQHEADVDPVMGSLDLLIMEFDGVQQADLDAAIKAALHDHDLGPINALRSSGQASLAGGEIDLRLERLGGDQVATGSVKLIVAEDTNTSAAWATKTAIQSQPGQATGSRSPSVPSPEISWRLPIGRWRVTATREGAAPTVREFNVNADNSGHGRRDVRVLALPML